MTTEKKLTPEQKRRGIAKKTLEHFLDIVGANETKQNERMYGELGVSCGAPFYEDYLENSEEAKEIRKAIHEKDKTKAKAVGNYEPVPIPQNFYVVQDILNQIQENQVRLKLGELEDIVTGITGELEFKVPEGLKNYSYSEIIEKYMNKEREVDFEKLKEDVVYNAYALFDKAYKHFAAQKIMAEHSMDFVNAEGKALFKAYEEAEKKKK